MDLLLGMMWIFPSIIIIEGFEKGAINTTIGAAWLHKPQ
jgi:hypothetical protein